MALFEERIAQAMEPYASQTELLISIPGMDRLVAWHLLAELGVDLKAFRDADHCRGWAGMGYRNEAPQRDHRAGLPPASGFSPKGS